MRWERICRFGIVNCYLVEEESGLTVIDTAIAGTAPKLLAAAERRGKPIERIVLTHAHSDHVGSVDALVEKLDGVELVISTRESKLLAGDKSLEPGEPETKVAGGFPRLDARPDVLVDPGQLVGSLEVVASPGHTPGHIALLDTRDGTLFCGDAYTTIGGTAVPSRIKWSFPLPYLATWNKPTALESARALRERSPSRLAPGHGKVIEDPAAAMDAAIAAAS